MQWLDAPCEPVPGPEDIVAWVNANGGEARYVPITLDPDTDPTDASIITIRTSTGWANAKPGYYIVMSDNYFYLPQSLGDLDAECPQVKLRVFYLQSPETFEREDWKLAPECSCIGSSHLGTCKYAVLPL